MHRLVLIVSEGVPVLAAKEVVQPPLKPACKLAKARLKDHLEAASQFRLILACAFMYICMHVFIFSRQSLCLTKGCMKTYLCLHKNPLSSLFTA